MFLKQTLDHNEVIFKEMKTIILSLLFSILFLNGFSQSSNVLSAWEYLETYKREKEAGNDEASIQALLDAKREIEPAITNANTMNQSKTWKRRGDIYYEIAVNKSPRLVLERDGALEKAAESYLKAANVEKKENGKPVVEDRPDVIFKLITIANRTMEQGNNFMDEKQYDKAMQTYGSAKNIYDETLLIDPKNTSLPGASGSALMGMVACAVYSDNKEQTVKYGSMAIEKGVADAWVYQSIAEIYVRDKNLTGAKEVLAKGKTKYPNEAAIYVAEVNIAFEEKNTDLATSLINEGKTKFPDKKADFVLAEVNIYITQGDDEKASTALEEAIATFQNDPSLLTVLNFNAGIIYDNLANKQLKINKELSKQYTEKAKGYYEKTLVVDPNYVSAYNQLANYHVGLGNDFINEANSLPFEKKKEYDALKAKSMDEFKKAAEYLEKGYAIKKDATIKNNLIEIYKKTQQLDKMKALMAE